MNAALLSRLRSGDERAWEELYDNLAADLRGYALRLGAKDPDDIVGDTMVNVVRDIGRFQGTDAEIRPWAFRIAHNRVVDAARRQKSRPVEVAPDLEFDDRTELAPLTETPDTSEISRLLNVLTEDQRAVIWLRFVADFSVAETAEITSRTTEAVAALTHRGLRTLRQHLGA